MAMTRIEVATTPIAGVQLITRRKFADNRGFLERLYDSLDFDDVMPGRTIHQVNRTYTKLAGTVRGLHIQLPPNEETKIVTCIKGSVFDVAVDLRSSSPTFLQWFGCELSESNARSLLIPQGCAHGVQTLEEDCELLYCHTALYSAKSDAGIHPLSMSIGIQWPMPISHLSQRDQDETSDPALFQGVTW